MYYEHMNNHADVGCATRETDAGKVEAVRQSLPSYDALITLADTFGVLSDPGRLRLLIALLAGEMCVCDLAATTGQSESGVSHALRLMRAHRVVTVRRSGRRAFYSLSDAHVRMLLDLALLHQAHASPLAAVSSGEAGG